MTDQPTPATPSSDYLAMSDFWGMVRDILGGVPSMRNNCACYLPKLPEESDPDHKMRVALSPFTNIYGDISGNLASKPFAKDLALSEDAAEAIAGAPGKDKVRTGGLVENIDAQGNSLHVFASNSFKEGVDKGLTWILVDFTRARQDGARPLSQAEEQAQGLRPYWVHMPPENVIAAYSVAVGGVDTLFHVRVLEESRERDGFGEKHVRRVRVMDRAFTGLSGDGTPSALGPATWALYEEQKVDGKDKPEWVLIDRGAYSIGIIPMVPVFIGQRVGSSFRVVPPLRDLAYMQVEEYQQEANLKSISMLTAFPMLAGNGVTPPVDAQTGQAIMVPVGPRRVLFAPPNADGDHGEWKFIEPSAESLKFLEERLNTFRDQMRDLGMQPLARANLTVVTTSNLSRKASSQVQKWAILFEDALDRALAITAMWLGIKDETSATLYKDFAVEAEEGAELDALLKAEGQSVVSKRTVAEEFKRRGVLSDAYDFDQEQVRIADQQAGATGEEDIDPVTGQKIPSNDPAIV